MDDFKNVRSLQLMGEMSKKGNGVFIHKCPHTVGIMFGCEPATRVGGRDRDGALLVWTPVREDEGDSREEQEDAQPIRHGLPPCSSYFYLTEANTDLQYQKILLSLSHFGTGLQSAVLSHATEEIATLVSYGRCFCDGIYRLVDVESYLAHEMVPVLRMDKVCDAPPW